MYVSIQFGAADSYQDFMPCYEGKTIDLDCKEEIENWTIEEVYDNFDSEFYGLY